MSNEAYSGLGGHPHERPAESPYSARFEPPLVAKSDASRSAEAPLAGLTFAAQDLFEIAGRTAGFGHPDWHGTHEAATATAPAVQACLDAGASLVGMTISDELAFSINGTHSFFDTPPNPSAPGHGPGGSSGGSASAVGLGDVDFALGPDVRAPSSYCGVFGFRSSTHLIDTEGMLPLAPSFDAVGWFARDAQMLLKVGEALLPQTTTHEGSLNRLIVARDAVGVAQEAVQTEVAQAIEQLSPHFDTIVDITLAPETLTEWAYHFGVIQAAEAWRYNGEWITTHGARLSSDVRARFERGIDIGNDEEHVARQRMAEIADHIHQVLGDDGVLLIPTAPFPAPQLGVPNDELEPYRPKMLELTSISGLGGIPQLCLPLMNVDGVPVGISLLSHRGTDLSLLQLGSNVCRN